MSVWLTDKREWRECALTEDLFKNEIHYLPKSMGPAPTSRAFYESALFNLKWTSTKISPFSTWVNCLNSYLKDWMVVSSSGGGTLNPDTHGTLIWSECVMSQSRSLRRYLRYWALSNECNILIPCHLQHSSTLVVLNRGIC